MKTLEASDTDYRKLKRNTGSSKHRVEIYSRAGIEGMTSLKTEGAGHELVGLSRGEGSYKRSVSTMRGPGLMNGKAWSKFLCNRVSGLNLRDRRRMAAEHPEERIQETLEDIVATVSGRA